jgi:two-component system LytT family sensor kinase
MRKYNIKVGLALSLFIAILASIPRLIRFEVINYEHIAGNIAYTFSYSFICWCCHHYFIQTRFLVRPLSIHWIKNAFSILICITISILYNKYIAAYLHIPVIPDPLEADPKLSMLLFRGTLVSGFLFFVAYYLYVLTATQQSVIENEKLKKENLQARLDSLKQQISPHFLFNSLSTLSSIAHETKVKEYIAELSNVYRYLLQVRQSNFVTVAEELAFVESYLYILSERFEDALKIRIEVDQNARQSKLPPLAVQMLVENAVKHNIASSIKPLFIEILSINKFLVVRNNYQPRQSHGSASGHGLPNIRDRYLLLANTSIEIEQGENYFSVKLPILT